MLQRLRNILILWLFCLNFGGLEAEAGFPIWALNNEIPSLAPMLEKSLPTVVNITKIEAGVRKNAGSGVVIEGMDGYIVTNYHVVKDAEKIFVTLKDGREFTAKYIGADEQMDIAVIQVPGVELSQIPLGDSSKLRIGDFVVSIGNPFGLGHSAGSGMVSALGRSGLGIEGYENFIQTDLPINPGNSGGALINLKGELVGINTAFISKTGGSVGISFAIPINMITKILDDLIEHGKVKRGSIGVVVNDFGVKSKVLEQNRNKGVLVEQVLVGSSAYLAGIRPGDIVLAIDNHKIKNTTELLTKLSMKSLGEIASLSVINDEGYKTVAVPIKLHKIKQAQTN